MILRTYRALSRSIRPCALLTLLVCFAMPPAWAGMPAHAQGGGNNTDTSDDGNNGNNGNNGNGRGNKNGHTEEEPELEPEPEPATQASISLSWDIATERENGDYLDQHDIEGHEIVYRHEGQATWSGSVFEDELLHGTTVDGLEPGTYYFAARTQDRDGLWSGYSEEMLVEIE